MQTVNFDAAGQPLWVAVTMRGLYNITYNITLLENSNSPSPIKILTEPVIAGNNDGNDARVVHPLVNVYNPGEALDAYDGRYVQIDFFITILEGDNGYNITIDVLQGSDKATAVNLGVTSFNGTFSADQKNHFICKLQLVKK